MVTPERIALAERVAWLLGLLAIVVAVGAFDWRLGVLCAGVLLVLASLDLPGRRT